MDEAQTFFRYEERTYSRGCDEFDNPYPGYTLELELLEFRMVKKTPKGAWISRYWEGNPRFDIRPHLSEERRFVRLGTRKQFAHPTKEEALESFRRRKKRQLKILEAQARQAGLALRMADQVEKGDGQSVPNLTVWG